MTTARQAGLVACVTCGRVDRRGAEECARCGDTLPHQSRRSLQTVWAWLFAGIALGLAVLVPPLSTNPPLLVNILALVVSVALAPVCQFATAPVVQGSLAATAGPSTTFVLTLNSSMVYLGQGTGVLLGGTAISFGGYAAAPLTGAFVALLGLVVAIALRSGTARSLSRT